MSGLTGPPASRISLHLVASPILLAANLSLIPLLGVFLAKGVPDPVLGPWGRLAVLLPLAVLASLTALDLIHRVVVEAEGIRVTSLAGLLLKRIFPARRIRWGRNFRLNWSGVDAVELRISRFQSPFRRVAPRGWLLAGSPGRVVRIPFGHPQFRAVLEVLRRFVHPYFVHLPSRDWEGTIPPRQALERMLRTVVFDPGTPSEFISETARTCLLWGNFARAERLMDLALAKREGDVKLLDDYFVLMKRLGNLEKAKPALERLLAGRQFPLDLVEMAEMRHAEGDEKGATECLLQAAEQAPSSDLAHFLLGCLYLQREGLEEAALGQWKKGLDVARHPQLLGKLGETYRYHRELLTRPEFLEGEHRRAIHWIWARRLGVCGVGLVLLGTGLRLFGPSSTAPFSGVSGSILILGGALMGVAILLRRRRRR